MPPSVHVGPVMPSKVNVIVCSSSPPISIDGIVHSEIKPEPDRTPPVSPSPSPGKVTVIVSGVPDGITGAPFSGNREVTCTVPASDRSAAIFFMKPVSFRQDASMESIEKVGKVSDLMQALVPERETVVPCPVVPIGAVILDILQRF